MPAVEVSSFGQENTQAALVEPAYLLSIAGAGTHADSVSLRVKALSARLQARIAVERNAERSGRSFRRHAVREAWERVLFKPVLKTLLQATGLYGVGQRNALQVTVKPLTLALENLPAQFDGLQIVHLSDLHVDALPQLAELVAATLRTLHADLCLMTGDYRFLSDGPCHEAIAGMRTVVESLSCPMGVYATLGNHDPCAIAPALERIGMRMLVNDSVPVSIGSDTIQIVGVDDTYDYRCADLPTALAGVPQDRFKILLAHSPDLYEQAGNAGIGLYLCGHTHAGQVRIPMFGALLSNTNAPKNYARGLWTYEAMQGFTSPGVGCSMLPVRFGCPPEITLFTLRRATV